MKQVSLYLLPCWNWNLKRSYSSLSTLLHLDRCQLSVPLSTWTISTLLCCLHIVEIGSILTIAMSRILKVYLDHWMQIWENKNYKWAAELGPTHILFYYETLPNLARFHMSPPRRLIAQLYSQLFKFTIIKFSHLLFYFVFIHLFCYYVNHNSQVHNNNVNALISKIWDQFL